MELKNVEEVGNAFLDDVEYLEKKFKDITKLSYWNPEEKIIRFLNESIKIPEHRNVVEYIFSYELDYSTKESMLKKFGIWSQSNNAEIVITPSGTASIYSVINLLKKKNINKIGVVAPVYFSFEHVCNNLDVNFECFYLKSKDGSFILRDPDRLDILAYDAIWITNPVYCTSVFYDDLKRDISRWLDLGKVVVFDESLCLYGYELIREFQFHENLISILSPHKALCVNGMKFSGIVTSKANSIILNEWLDIIVGCLSISNKKAIDHFLSDNFDQVNFDFITKVLIPNQKSIFEICRKYGVITDITSLGGFMTLYFKNIPLDYFDKPSNLKEMMNLTNCSFIPGSRNYFDPKEGFCFRVNLSRVTRKFLEDLEELVKYLKKLERKIMLCIN